jgi:sodium/proline symporter
MFNAELLVFIVYLVFMVGIGIFFFLRSKSSGEKGYFLGGRQMGPWVSALSAGASDMSAWVLMGLPASIYAAGLGQAWIAIGLAIGYAISWLVEAPRLRRYSIAANDSITIPQYLTNRFLSKSRALQVISAVIFLVAYTVYAASSIKACGTLFNTVLGIDATFAMYLAAVIIICYTFLGGFSAVCWTDFFQGLLMLGALLIAPIFALGIINSSGSVGSMSALPEGYFNLFTNWKDILSGLGWGLGYFGMPHIIIRFMSLRSDKDVKKSAKIGITWTVLILTFSVAAGVIGHLFLGEIADSSVVFITMVRKIFPARSSHWKCPRAS